MNINLKNIFFKKLILKFVIELDPLILRQMTEKERLHASI